MAQLFRPGANTWVRLLLVAAFLLPAIAMLIFPGVFFGFYFLRTTSSGGRP